MTALCLIDTTMFVQKCEYPTKIIQQKCQSGQLKFGLQRNDFIPPLNPTTPNANQDLFDHCFIMLMKQSKIVIVTSAPALIHKCHGFRIWHAATCKPIFWSGYLVSSGARQNEYAITLCCPKFVNPSTNRNTPGFLRVLHVKCF